MAVTPDHIVTGAAVDRVRAGAAQQHVVAIGADTDLPAVARKPHDEGVWPPDVTHVRSGAANGGRARDRDQGAGERMAPSAGHQPTLIA